MSTEEAAAGEGNPPVRVLIVDDDPLVRSGLTLMLGGAPGVEVVGEAADGSEVLGALDRHRAAAVLVLTTFDTDDQVLRALRRGAAGFLVKDTPPAEIVRAIELVAAGESMLSPTVTRRLIDRLAGDQDADVRHNEAAAQLGELSPRDREIAAAIAQGKSNAAIAAELHLSVATIKSHVSAMLAKLQLDNRVQIALMVQDAERV